MGVVSQYLETYFCLLVLLYIFVTTKLISMRLLPFESRIDAQCFSVAAFSVEVM